MALLRFNSVSYVELLTELRTVTDFRSRFSKNLAASCHCTSGNQ